MRAVKPDYEFSKQVELEPSEYTYEGKHEPFFGPAAKVFLICLVLSFPISAFASWIVTGQWPYWAGPLLHEAINLTLFVGGSLLILKLIKVVTTGFSGRRPQR
jgi:hypothetical protein